MTEPHFGTGKNTTKIFGKLIDRINVVGPLLTNMHRETKSALDKVLVVTAGCFCSEYETESDDRGSNAWVGFAGIRQ